MATTARRLFPGSLLGALAGALLVACGGSSPEAESPGATGADDGASSSDTSEPEPSPEELQAERSRTLQASCDDGTCFSCGDGVCPVGTQAQARAPSGAAAQ